MTWTFQLRSRKRISTPPFRTMVNLGLNMIEFVCYNGTIPYEFAKESSRGCSTDFPIQDDATQQPGAYTSSQEDRKQSSYFRSYKQLSVGQMCIELTF